ncbi:germinal-center associated nuclear protein isoform X2 [Bacillus rossius redtenbacheri]|uniref:germinal-center associated nuclear protein isoform X2 n=1 Tax=Bacillus rossius redtenbacheri TaxID=93214 RepID=UPI002FDEDDA7
MYNFGVNPGEDKGDKSTKLFGPSDSNAFKKALIDATKGRMSEEQSATPATDQLHAIYISSVPHSLLHKDTMTQHFSQFGGVRRVYISNVRRSAIVHFSDHETARRAKESGVPLQGHKLDVYWSKSAKVLPVVPGPDQSAVSEPPEARARRRSAKYTVSAEVQEELMAMSGGDVTRYEERPVPHKRRAAGGRRSRPAEGPRPGPGPGPGDQAEVDGLLALAGKPALSPEDRYKTLEARDRLLRKMHGRGAMKRSPLQGTCPDMCSEKERYHREITNQVAVYERLSSSEEVRMDHERAVKQYSRSSADQDDTLCHELRPAPVLQRTMRYLLAHVVDSRDRDANPYDWFHFLWDRTRSIRKDITQQELSDRSCIALMEQCARFHIHCAEQLVAEDPAVFDQKINTENLTKCLQTLKYMYGDAALKGEPCVCEPEFRAYTVLLNLNDGNFLWDLKQVRPEVLRSPEVQFALRVHAAISSQNYVRFFRLVRHTSYLNACLLQRYFCQVRTGALLSLCKASCPGRARVQLPVARLMELLAFENLAEMLEFLGCCGLVEYDSAGQDCVVMSRGAVCVPKLPPQTYRAPALIESKMNCSIAEVVYGGPLPPDAAEIAPVHSSFDDSGRLKPAALYLSDGGVFRVPAGEAVPKRKKTVSPVSETLGPSTDRDLNVRSADAVITPETPVSVPKPAPSVHGAVATQGGTAAAAPVFSVRADRPGDRGVSSETRVLGSLAGTSGAAERSPASMSWVPRRAPAVSREPAEETASPGNTETKIFPVPSSFIRREQQHASLERRGSCAQEDSRSVSPRPAGVAARAAVTLISPRESSPGNIAIARLEEQPHKHAEPERKQQEGNKQKMMQDEVVKKAEEEKRRDAAQTHTAQQVLAGLIVDLARDVCSAHLREAQCAALAQRVLHEVVHSVVTEHTRALLVEAVRSRRLGLLAERVAARKTRAVCHKWRGLVARHKKHREAAEGFPPLTLLQTSPGDLYVPRPAQVALLHLPGSSPGSLDATCAQLDVAAAVSRQLLLRMSSLDCSDADVTWKLVVSLPDDRESIYEQEASVSARELFRGNKCAIHHSDAATVACSVVLVAARGSTQAVRGRSGVLVWVASGRDDWAAVERRLQHCVAGSVTRPAVPVSLLLVRNTARLSASDVAARVGVQRLVSAGCVSHFTVHQPSTTSSQAVRRAVEGAVRWLAERAPDPRPVVLCPLHGLMDELLRGALRQVALAARDSAFGAVAAQSPNNVLLLYNKMLRVLQEYLLDPELRQYGMGAPVCGTARYCGRIAQVLKSAQLAPIRPWPPASLCELVLVLERYCDTSCLLDHWPLYSYMERAVRDFFREGRSPGRHSEWAEFLQSVNWMKVVQIIVSKKLESMQMLVAPEDELQVAISKKNLAAFLDTFWWFTPQEMEVVIETPFINGNHRQRKVVARTSSERSRDRKRKDSARDEASGRSAKKSCKSVTSEIDASLTALKSLNEEIMKILD